MDNYNYDKYLKENYMVLGESIIRDLTWSGGPRRVVLRKQCRAKI